MDNQNVAGQKKDKTFAYVSLVFSILALILLIPAATITMNPTMAFAVPGFFMGLEAQRETKSPVAKLGVILSLIAFVLGVFMLIIGIMVISGAEVPDGLMMFRGL
ncbi:MAG: hypothetical protein GXY32_04550 [Ruminococcaceae bacterium]|nr:hypothetical protein [Oscillospiraceae bacterium]